MINTVGEDITSGFSQLRKKLFTKHRNMIQLYLNIYKFISP